LADDAVVSTKIHDGSVTSLDVANSTIRGTDVRDHTLTRADLKRSALVPGPRGPLGPQGPPGARGAPGRSGRQVVEAETGLSSVSPKGATALCPPGKKALGGGASVNGLGRDRVSITDNAPVGESGWHARAVEIAAAATWRLRVYAVCVFVAG